MEDRQNLTKIPKGIMLGCGASVVVSLLLCIFSSYVIPKILGVEEGYVLGGSQYDLQNAANCYVPIALAGVVGFAVWFLVYNWYMRQRKRKG